MINNNKIIDLGLDCEQL